jgi:hypothetical protein
MTSPVMVFGRADSPAFTLSSNGRPGIRQIAQRIFRPGFALPNRQQDLNSPRYYGERRCDELSYKQRKLNFAIEPGKTPKKNHKTTMRQE